MIFFHPISAASRLGGSFERLTNVRPPQRIDLTDPTWTWQAGEKSGQPLAAMLCINVLHISPWRVSQICSPAPGGCCVQTAGCSCMDRSFETASTRHRAMRPLMPPCGPRTRNGVFGIFAISPPLQTKPAFHLPKSRRCQRIIWCWPSPAGFGTINPPTDKETDHARRTDLRHCPSRPPRDAHTEIRGKPQILHRRHGHDPERREGRQRLSAGLGRL